MNECYLTAAIIKKWRLALTRSSLESTYTVDPVIVNVLCKMDQSHMALGPRKSGVFGRCAARNSLRCGLKTVSQRSFQSTACLTSESRIHRS